MAISYFVTPISENLGRDPNTGILVARGAVIARTGIQQYRGSDLPKDEVKDLALAIEDDAAVDLYRSPEVVFSEQTISSFEGKPITWGHPSKFLACEASPETYAIADYQKGHVQNVRRGDAPLSSGDWPLVADLIITDADLIEEIESGRLRELSCGYGYHLGRENNRILQIDLTGNHVAVVPRGRAGAEARINDSAATAVTTTTVAAAVTQTVPSPVAPKQQVKKEKPKVAFSIGHILGLGLKKYSEEADPDELAAAAKAIAAHDTQQKPKYRAYAADESEEEEEERKRKEKGEDKAKDRAKDCDCASKDSAKDSKTTDGKGKDARRAAFHDALDKALDEATDANLKRFLDSITGKDAAKDTAKDAKHKDKDDDPDEDDDREMEDAGQDEEDPEDETEEEREKRKKREEGKDRKSGKGHDSHFIEPIAVGVKKVKPGAKTASQGLDAMDVLDELRADLASGSITRAQKGFNRVLAKVRNTGSGNGSGAYGTFAEAARTHSQANDQRNDPGARVKKLSGMYDKLLRGEKLNTEVQ